MHLKRYSRSLTRSALQCRTSQFYTSVESVSNIWVWPVTQQHGQSTFVGSGDSRFAAKNGACAWLIRPLQVFARVKKGLFRKNKLLIEVTSNSASHHQRCVRRTPLLVRRLLGRLGGADSVRHLRPPQALRRHTRYTCLLQAKWTKQKETMDSLCNSWHRCARSPLVATTRSS